MECLTSHCNTKIGYDIIKNSEFFVKLAPCSKGTDTDVLDGLISRIIRQVSRDVLLEDSHIFQVWERPFKRTIKVIGDTGNGIRTYRCTTKNHTHVNIV
jgi:hypothetical protein